MGTSVLDHFGQLQLEDLQLVIPTVKTTANKTAMIRLLFFIIVIFENILNSNF